MRPGWWLTISPLLPWALCSLSLRCTLSHIHSECGEHRVGWQGLVCPCVCEAWIEVCWKRCGTFWCLLVVEYVGSCVMSGRCTVWEDGNSVVYCVLLVFPVTVLWYSLWSCIRWDTPQADTHGSPPICQVFPSTISVIDSSIQRTVERAYNISDNKHLQQELWWPCDVDVKERKWTRISIVNLMSGWWWLRWWNNYCSLLELCGQTTWKCLQHSGARVVVSGLQIEELFSRILPQNRFARIGDSGDPIGVPATCL